MSSKKKIGIMTFWESNDNYGQQLQCWALQHFLRERGYDAFLIRLMMFPQRKVGFKRIKQRAKDIISWTLYATKLAYIPFFANIFSFCIDKEGVRRRFPSFRLNNLSMSRVYESPEDLINNYPVADIYICGSDQIWNYIMPRESYKCYFLQFGNADTKRIAYAPSIGQSKIPDEYKEEISSYLKSFNSISLREKSAVKMIEELGFQADHVLDPTLLINCKDYRKITNSMEEESIFIYSINYESQNDIPFAEIKQYAHKKSLPVIVTPGGGYIQSQELFDEVQYCYATIPQWISLIEHAKLVVTASFHGIVFCVLFHKSFIYTPLKGKYSGSNNRVLDLLEEIGLESQIYTNSKQIQEYEISNVAWKKVDRKLDLLINCSKDFLKNSING